MAFLSRDGRRLVVVVMYDGPPESGKTSNVRALDRGLLQGRPGSVLSPGSTARRTEFFDWREFDGGHGDPLPHRVVVLSAPGQFELVRRRRALLSVADASVFVVDGAARDLTTARAMLRDYPWPDIPRRLVLQANKQDNEDAAPSSLVAARLGLPRDVTALDAAADRDEGVSATFLAASRLAVAHANERLRLDQPPAPAFETPAELLRLIQSAPG